MINRIQWLGHSTFRIQGPPLIYIDPWRVPRGACPADMILVSSDRYDHCSPADVSKLLGPNTRVVANAAAAKLLGGEGGVQVLRPWQSVNIGRARITAIPARAPNANPYLPDSEGVGFLVSLDYYDIYYAGDTGVIPDMARLRPDIAILPLGGDSAMSVNAAVEAVNILRPRWVIPGHCSGEGSSYLDMRAFQQAVGGRAEVMFLNRVH